MDSTVQVLRADSLRCLLNYLHYHELDIASEENDFGDLRPLFEDVYGREPSKK